MKLEDWMNRQLDEVYVSTIIIRHQVYKRINGVPKRQEVYIFLGINLKGHKKFIDVIVPKEETTSYWFNIITKFKERGIEDFFMVAMVNNQHLKKAFKMVFPNVILMPSMCEFYNNSRPYILQKEHRKLLGQIQKIYVSENEMEAKKLCKELINKYKENKLLLMVINRCISDIINVIKYSQEARRITSYTESFIKLKAKLNREVNDYKVFEETIEIKLFFCELLKKEEEQFKPSKRNWALIINEMDSVITDKIKEKI